jgi:hypothetical protein
MSPRFNLITTKPRRRVDPVALRPDVWARAKRAELEIGYTIINGVSLEELEPLFAEMVRAGVEPTEKVPHQAFWANAKRAVRALPVLQEEAAAEATADVRPCECVFIRPPKRGARDTTVCTCLAPPGTGHYIHCARVMGDRRAA